MERTFPQKVKPVPSCEVEEGVMVSQIRQTPSDANRRIRTSAAVIGLALSVGAYGMPLPNQGDEAIAAEPVASEPTTSALPSEFDIASASQRAGIPESAQSRLSAGMIEHTVQEGQTLWQLARLYRIDAATVAFDNGIPVSAVLHVGQVLKIPGNGQVSAGVQIADASVTQPNVTQPKYYGSIDGTQAVVVGDGSAASPAPYKTAPDGMKQKQERLRLSLAKLKTSKQAASPAKPVQAASEPTVVATSQARMSYQVVRGDTLGVIAKANNVSLRALVAANNLSDPNVLNVDQVLVIPQPHPDASQTAPVLVASASPDQLTLPARAINLQRQPNLVAQSRATDQASTSASRSMAALSNRSGRVLAVEQTLPTVSLTHSSVLPNTMRGTTEVATSSFVGKQPAPVEQASSSVQYSYVENLRLEIVKLRAKYQGSESEGQTALAPTTKVAAAPLNIAAPSSATVPSTVAAIPIAPTRYTRALQAQVRQLQVDRQQSKRAEMQSAAADLAPVTLPSKPQIVATASLGSQSYEPLMQSPVGQMVSPDLPPIGSIDAYLPGSAGKFNGYIWPTKGVLTSGFGYRWGRMHKGIDIAAPVGTPVFAAAAGVVITSGWNSGGYGNMVEIQHPDGSVTLYAHNSRIVVREGQEVAQGQQIADMGSTGYSTGPHSHFEVHLPGRGAVNPMAFLPREQA